jgi:hypothetical protein
MDPEVAARRKAAEETAARLTMQAFHSAPTQQPGPYGTMEISPLVAAAQAVANKLVSPTCFVTLIVQHPEIDIYAGLLLYHHICARFACSAFISLSLDRHANRMFPSVLPGVLWYLCRSVQPVAR